MGSKTDSFTTVKNVSSVILTKSEYFPRSLGVLNSHEYFIFK